MGRQHGAGNPDSGATARVLWGGRDYQSRDCDGDDYAVQAWLVGILLLDDGVVGSGVGDCECGVLDG